MAREIAQAIFENNAEAIYLAMLKALKKGSPRAFKELAERGYGKLPQAVDANIHQEVLDCDSTERPRQLIDLATRRAVDRAESKNEIQKPFFND